MHSLPRLHRGIAPPSRHILLTVTLALAACAALLLLPGCASTPAPTAQMAVANAAVASANSAGGSEWAPAEMRAARDKIARANTAIANEDNDGARRLAQQAQVDAQLASSKARAAKARQAADAVQQNSSVLQEELDRKARPAASPVTP